MQDWKDNKIRITIMKPKWKVEQGGVTCERMVQHKSKAEET